MADCWFSHILLEKYEKYKSVLVDVLRDEKEVMRLGFRFSVSVYAFRDSIFLKRQDEFAEFQRKPASIKMSFSVYPS